MEFNMILPNADSLVYMQPQWQTEHSAWAEHLPAAFWLIEQLKPRSFVELGSHAGDSYCAFAQAIVALGLDQQGATAMAIDTWQGDAHSEHYGSEIYDNLNAHHAPLYGHFSELNKKLFDDALADVEGGSVDLLHIDGLHTYEAVKHDFETWRPKMSERGVILFHDVSERHNDFGVWKLWDELILQFPHLLMPHGHGLGILSVGHEIPKEFSALLTDAGAAELSESQRNLIAFLYGLGQAYEHKRQTLLTQYHLENTQNAHRDTLDAYQTLETHLNAIQHSKSWKLTAPLRKLRGGA
jgi:hypothetical protein